MTPEEENILAEGLEVCRQIREFFENHKPMTIEE